MKRALLGVLALACTGAFAGIAAADIPCPGDGGSGDLAKAKIALHAQSYTSSKACTKAAPSAIGCSDGGTAPGLVHNWPEDTKAAVYVLVLDVDPAAGVLGATFGVNYQPYTYADYSGVYVNPYETIWCAQQVFGSSAPDPNFPTEPGSGAAVTFTACQNTVDGTDPEGEALVVLGLLSVSAYDYYGTYNDLQIAATPRLYLPSPDFQVANCAAASSEPCYPEFAGIVGFGPNPGYSPCVQVVATEETTWGRLKRFDSGE